MRRVLGLETSGLRGSVALWEGDCEGNGQLAGYASHEVRNEHAERMLTLVEEVLAQACWEKESVTRVAVGVGPGSFTGVRVALSIAQGLSLGLGVPGVGVGSLRAMALGAEGDPRSRVVVRDARRDEFFVAHYAPSGEELVAPYVVAQADAPAHLKERYFSLGESAPSAESAGTDAAVNVLVGQRVGALPYLEGETTCEADARAVARWGARVDPELHPLVPHYLRGPNLIRPELHPSPLSEPRKTSG